MIKCLQLNQRGFVFQPNKNMLTIVRHPFIPSYNLKIIIKIILAFASFVLGHVLDILTCHQRSFRLSSFLIS